MRSTTNPLRYALSLAFLITRDGVTSLPDQVTDGTMTISYTFDTLGRVLSLTHERDGEVMYQLQLIYDVSGRLEGRIETVMGTAQDYTYTYDSDEQLTGVAIDTVPVESYGYDSNGNRTLANAVPATYDTADSLFMKAELVATLGPVGFGGELKANDCGTSLKKKCSTFLLSCSGKVSAGAIGSIPVMPPLSSCIVVIIAIAQDA